MSWSQREQHDLMHLLELDPGVLGYTVAPEKITYVVDGHERTHVPAFRVRTRRGDAILDSFPDRDQDTAARKRTIAALTEAYADRGTPYRAIQGSRIRLQPRFGNASWLLRERTYRPAQEETLRLLGFLSARKSATVAEIRLAVPKAPNLTGLLCALVIRGELRVDLSAEAPDHIRVALLAGATR